MSTALSRIARILVPSVATVLVASASVVGCAMSGDIDSEETDSIASEMSASEAVSRAMEWANANLQYCQSANHQRDYDSACSSVCNRTNNAAWDPYRSDCSGLVSWAWGLPAPGRVTTQFAPFENDITHSISASSLAPGDAVNNSDHVMLFKAWVTPGREATFIEEPGCSSNPPHAHTFTSSVSVNGDSIYVSYTGMTFTAIRYNSISGSGSSPSGPPSCNAGGESGTCIDTSACAAKGGHHSTPGLCPGPAQEECCTPNAAPVPPSSPPKCQAGGESGTCIDKSVCAAKGGHHSTPGLCPGPASEECCTADAAPPPPPPATGPSCTVESVHGVCISTSACHGMPGHISTPGFCPGPASEECCTAPKSCNVHGVSGLCMETSVCAGMPGHHSTAGYCPGPANEECCTP